MWCVVYGVCLCDCVVSFRDWDRPSADRTVGIATRTSDRGAGSVASPFARRLGAACIARRGGEDPRTRGEGTNLDIVYCVRVCCLVYVVFVCVVLLSGCGLEMRTRFVYVSIGFACY